MAIQRRWTPTTIPLTNDLPAWKAICEDIHLNLILAGWEQTDDSGQLDFEDVTVLPPDEAFAGYRAYLLNDPLKEEFPIIMRLDFGCGIEGLAATNAPNRPRGIRIKSQFGISTNSAGYFLGQSFGSEHPQSADRTSATGSSTSQNTLTGVSTFYSNPAAGFYGFIYGAGSRNYPSSNSNNGAYIGASLAIFLQRDTDENGQPIATGFSVILPDLHSSSNSIGWFSGSDSNPARMYHFSASGVTDTIHNAQRVGPPKISQSFAGEVAFQPVYVSNPQFRRWPYLLTYYHSDVEEGTTVSLPVAYGQNKPFICLGNMFGMPVDPLNYEWGSWAMGFDGDEVSP